MINETLEVLDYEISDDLPLWAHIEWHRYIAEEIELEDIYELDWLTA